MIISRCRGHQEKRNRMNLTTDIFHDGFAQLLKLCRERAAVNGDYFEGGEKKQFHLVSCVSILSDRVPELY